MGFAHLGYYANQSDVTDPGRMAPLLDGLPTDLAELRRLVSGLVIHYRAHNPIEQGVPVERMREIDTRYAESMLARIAELNDAPLTAPRSPTERLVGCCRDFTVVFLTMARAMGIPARGRVGYAMYFVPEYGVNHEIVEAWDADEGRWRLIDAELADDHTDPDGVPLDPMDVPRDRFVLAGDAWRQCRAGDADPARFVVDPGLDIEELHGWPQIHCDLLHDLAALNKTEMLLWDSWSDPAEIRTEPYRDRIDRVAALVTEPDPDVVALRRVFEGDPALRVPDTVHSNDPLGGPRREVAWRELRQGARASA